MQSRTIVRIEGDLVSLVTEMVEREVLLSDFEAELSRSRLAASPRLPAGTRFWFHAGTTDRSVIVVEQEPGYRTIEYLANRYDSEPVTYRLALPYVVFVVSVVADQIMSLSCYFRTEPLRSLDDPLLAATMPNTDAYGIVCLGTVRVTGASLAERIDSLIAAFWGRGSTPKSGAIRCHSVVVSGPGRPAAGATVWSRCRSGSTRWGRPSVRPSLGQAGSLSTTSLGPPPRQAPRRSRSGPRTRNPTREVTPMTTLRDHVARMSSVEPRSLALLVAPHLAERSDRYREHLIEAAALTVLGAVVQRSAVTREELVLERRRFNGLVSLIHRLPVSDGGGS